MGAVGILGFASNVTQIDESMMMLVDSWQSIARPLTDFMFGWLFALLGVQMPVFAKDYLAVALVVCGALYRTDYVIHVDFYTSGSDPQKHAIGFSRSSGLFGRAASIYWKGLAKSFAASLLWPYVVLERIWTLNHEVRLSRTNSRSTLEDVSGGIEGRIHVTYSPRRSFAVAFEMAKLRRFVFAETFVYALILLAVNYWLLFDL